VKKFPRSHSMIAVLITLKKLKKDLKIERKYSKE